MALNRLDSKVLDSMTTWPSVFPESAPFLNRKLGNRIGTRGWFYRAGWCGPARDTVRTDYSASLFRQSTGNNPAVPLLTGVQRHLFTKKYLNSPRATSIFCHPMAQGGPAMLAATQIMPRRRNDTLHGSSTHLGRSRAILRSVHSGQEKL